MTVKELSENLDLKLLAGSAGLQNNVTGCYIGDLLSWVMGKATEGDAWITVMGNINAIAVATLTDSACIILTDNAALDDNAKARADTQGIPILLTEHSSYRTAVAISKLLGDD